MLRQTSSIVLGLMQLQRGYGLSIDNAVRCLGASSELANQYPDKALGLAQLGQEEIGKSLSLLAAGALPQERAWEWLSQGWRDHQMKAHRAYFYEIIHPLRIEAPHPEGGEHYDGGPLLDRLSAEKEIGFYIDLDESLKSFVSPEELVDGFSAAARMSTLAYLTGTADAVRRTLMHDDCDFRFREFAKVAFTICTEPTYQQDWPRIREGFAAQSARHQAIIDDLDRALKGTADFFKDAIAKKK